VRKRPGGRGHHDVLLAGLRQRDVRHTATKQSGRKNQVKGVYRAAVSGLDSGSKLGHGHWMIIRAVRESEVIRRRLVYVSTDAPNNSTARILGVALETG
jgi:hypothetical protein